MPLPSEAIVATFDPGLTTGYCVVQVAHDLPAGFVVLESGVVKWSTRVLGVRALLRKYRPNLTVVEEFKLYKHKAQDQIGSDFPSVRVIGIIETYMVEFELGAPAFQGAALIAGAPPVRILEEHVSLLHNSEHARDAYKHARYFVSRARRQHAA